MRPSGRSPRANILHADKRWHSRARGCHHPCYCIADSHCSIPALASPFQPPFRFCGVLRTPTHCKPYRNRYQEEYSHLPAPSGSWTHCHHHGSQPMVLTSSEDCVPTGVIPIVRHPPYHSPGPALHQASPLSSPEVRHRCCCLPRTSSSTDNITAVRPPTVTALRTAIAGCRLHVAAESHCDCVATTHCIHSSITYQDQHSRLHRRSDTVRIPTRLRHYGLRTESARLPHQNRYSITGPYHKNPTDRQHRIFRPCCHQPAPRLSAESSEPYSRGFVPQPPLPFSAA